MGEMGSIAIAAQVIASWPQQAPAPPAWRMPSAEEKRKARDEVSRSLNALAGELGLQPVPLRDASAKREALYEQICGKGSAEQLGRLDELRSRWSRAGGAGWQQSFLDAGLSEPAIESLIANLPESELGGEFCFVVSIFYTKSKNENLF